MNDFEEMKNSLDWEALDQDARTLIEMAAHYNEESNEHIIKQTTLLLAAAMLINPEFGIIMLMRNQGFIRETRVMAELEEKARKARWN